MNDQYDSLIYSSASGWLQKDDDYIASPSFSPYLFLFIVCLQEVIDNLRSVFEYKGDF